jgi:hypothetical protein
MREPIEANRQCQHPPSVLVSLFSLSIMFFDEFLVIFALDAVVLFAKLGCLEPS